jgi:excisionase family DNA binding protein
MRAGNMADVESDLLAGFQALIEREVDRRVQPIEDLLKKGAKGQAAPVEEFLDVDELARRIHTEPKTIRDWVHKKKIPFQKLPTGGIRFAWSKVEAWVKGQES